MTNPAKPEIKAAGPRTYTTLWDEILRLYPFTSSAIQITPFTVTSSGCNCKSMVAACAASRARP